MVLLFSQPVSEQKTYQYSRNNKYVGGGKLPASQVGELLSSSERACTSTSEVQPADTLLLVHYPSRSWTCPHHRYPHRLIHYARLRAHRPRKHRLDFAVPDVRHDESRDGRLGQDDASRFSSLDVPSVTFAFKNEYEFQFSLVIGTGLVVGPISKHAALFLGT